jgi:hypothetical protein
MAYYDDGENSQMKRFGTRPVPENFSDVEPYYEKRSEEYPDIGEQLDDLFKQGLFSAAMTARIQAVKDRYAKETDEEIQAKIDAHLTASDARVAEEESRRQEEEAARLAAKLAMENEALEEYYQNHPEERP